MVIYKYLKKEHLLKFKANGSIRISTLYNLREVEHEPIRDELEGHHKIKISSNKQSVRFSGKEFHKMIPVLEINKQQEEKISVVIENGTQFDMQIANAFLFCTSLRLDHSLFTRFGYDAYYKITNPFDFATILYEKLNQVVTIGCFKLDAVKYVDKPITITSRNKGRILSDREDQYWNACFAKPRRFSEEREFRMAFVPEFAREIKPIILTCPELREFCAFS
jgi:hypothetical protein